MYEDGSNIFTEYKGGGGFIDFNKQKIRKKLTSIKVYNLLRTQDSSIHNFTDSGNYHSNRCGGVTE